MADIAELGLKINSQPVDQAGAKLRNFGKIASDTERKVIQSTNGMTTGFKSFRSSVQTSAPVITKFEKTAKTATKSGGNFANSIRQVSLQLSQVAQQGAVTGDFFRAFTIQLPDLLLSFGTLGILIGAVAGALGGPLIDALTGSSKETKELDNNIKELIGSLESSERQANETILARLKEQAQAATSEIESLKDVTQELSGRRLRAVAAGEEGRLAKIREITEELLELESKSANSARARTAQSVKRRRLESELAELKGVDESRSKQIIEIEERRAKILEAIAKVESEINKETRESNQQQLDVRNSQLESRLNEFEKVKTAILDQNKTERQLAIEGASETNSALAAAYSDNLIDFNEYRSLRAEAQLALQEELTQIDEKAQQQRTQILTAGQEAALSASGQLFGNLASIAKEGGEDQFQEYKNLASAQAAIAASLAAIKALAEGGPILGPALAVSIGAVAAIQIAKIQGQEYQSSRASGGQAKGRVLVGENGPEILNMGNSTGSITSAAGTKQELGGQTVQQIFNISPGLSGAIQAEMRAMLPLIQQVAISGVSNDMRNGGSTAKAVGLR